MTKQKLYDKAGQPGIPGQSTMSRDELRDAVKTAEGERTCDASSACSRWL
jgi:hypothetical protein